MSGHDFFNRAVLYPMVNAVNIADGVSTDLAQNAGGEIDGYLLWLIVNAVTYAAEGMASLLKCDETLFKQYCEITDKVLAHAREMLEKGHKKA